MNIYFNQIECSSATNLKENYSKWFKNSHDDYFQILIIDDGNITFDRKFIRNEHDDIFNTMYKQLNQKLLENLDNVYIARSIEEDIDTIDFIYCIYFHELHSEISIELNHYTFDEYITEEETLIIAQRCAIYDIENDNSNIDVEQLTQEYMNLSTEQLLEEYEIRYNDDFHISYIQEQYSYVTDVNMKRIIDKSLSQYQSLKNYHFKNNISFEMRKRT